LQRRRDGKEQDREIQELSDDPSSQGGRHVQRTRTAHVCVVLTVRGSLATPRAREQDGRVGGTSVSTVSTEGRASNRPRETGAATGAYRECVTTADQ
jgi:hypothetical protein